MKADVTVRRLRAVRLPHETFSADVKDGSAGEKTRAILDEVRPEAVYFTEMNGQRTVVMIVELEKSSAVPALAEPWFLTFEADGEFHVVMSPEDFQEAGLDRLGQKWGRFTGTSAGEIGTTRAQPSGPSFGETHFNTTITPCMARRV